MHFLPCAMYSLHTLGIFYTVVSCLPYQFGLRGNFYPFSQTPNDKRKKNLFSLKMGLGI